MSLPESLAASDRTSRSIFTVAPSALSNRQFPSTFSDDSVNKLPEDRLDRSNTRDRRLTFHAQVLSRRNPAPPSGGPVVHARGHTGGGFEASFTRGDFGGEDATTAFDDLYVDF